MKPDLKEIVRQAMEDHYGYEYRKFTDIVSNSVAYRYEAALRRAGEAAQEAERLAGWTPLANARQGVINAARELVRKVPNDDPLCGLRAAVKELDVRDGTAPPIEIAVNGKKFTLPALTFLDYGEIVRLSGQPYRSDYSIIWFVLGQGGGGFIHPPTVNKSELVKISKGLHITCVWTGNA